MLTGRQIRAARALLRWNSAELADKAGVAPNTVVRAEAVDGVPPLYADSLDKIQTAFEAAGVEFLDGDGVRLNL